MKLLFKKAIFFLIPAVVAGALFGAFIMLAMRSESSSPVLVRQSNIAVVSGSERPNAYIPAKEECMTFVVCGESGAQSLLRFDVVNGRVSVLSLPGQTQATLDGEETTLEQARRKGWDKLKAAYHESFGITVDRYYYASDKSVESLIGAVGNVEFNLAEDISGSLSAGSIELPKGRYSLDAHKITTILASKTLAEDTKANVVSALAGELLAQKLEMVKTEKGDTAVSRITTSGVTDFSSRDYTKLKPALLFMLKITEKPVNIIETKGEMQGLRFVLDDELKDEISLIFS